MNGSEKYGETNSILSLPPNATINILDRRHEAAIWGLWKVNDLLQKLNKNES